MSFTQDVYQRLTVRGVQRDTYYREQVPASPTYSFDTESGQGTQDFYIPWQQKIPGNPVIQDTIPQARMDFLGYTSVQTIGGVKYLSRVIPYEHPSFLNDLFAQKIPKVSGFIPRNPDLTVSPKGGDAQGVAFYQEATVNVAYSTLPYEILTDFELAQANADGSFSESTWQRYVNIHLDTTGHNERLPSFAALRWVDDQTPMDNAAVVPLCRGDLTVIWYQVPIVAIPWTAQFVYVSSGKPRLPDGKNQTVLQDGQQATRYRHNLSVQVVSEFQREPLLQVAREYVCEGYPHRKQRSKRLLQALSFQRSLSAGAVSHGSISSRRVAGA